MKTLKNKYLPVHDRFVWAELILMLLWTFLMCVYIAPGSFTAELRIMLQNPLLLFLNIMPPGYITAYHAAAYIHLLCVEYHMVSGHVSERVGSDDRAPRPGIHGDGMMCEYLTVFSPFVESRPVVSPHEEDKCVGGEIVPETSQCLVCI